jgi:preprotein translocase SecE subunit
VVLLGEADAQGNPVNVGTAVVQEWRSLPSGGATLQVEHLKLEPKRDLSQVKKLSSAEPGVLLSGAVSGTPQGDPLFPPMYIQGAGVGLLMIAGALLTWWLVGVRHPTVEFLIATDGEMKKVNWSTRKDVTASTWVVVMWSVLLAGGLFGIDFLFSQFFKLIGVLQS